MMPYLYTPGVVNFMEDYYGASVRFVHPDIPICLYTDKNRTTAVSLLKYCYIYPGFMTGPFSPEQLLEIVRQKLRPDVIDLKIFNSNKYSRLICSIRCFTKQPSLTDFDKKTRNQVRKSLGYGFVIRVNPSIAEIYPIYQTTMKRLKSRSRNQEYFDKLEKHLDDNLLILGVYKEDRLCAANIAFVNKDYLLLMFSFSLPEFLPACVNNFLYYQTIVYGFKTGIRIFDFGPADISDKTHRHFKNGFGAMEYFIDNVKWSKNHWNQFWNVLNRKLASKLLLLKNYDGG